jgi:DNA topoisomerase-1
MANGESSKQNGSKNLSTSIHKKDSKDQTKSEPKLHGDKKPDNLSIKSTKNGNNSSLSTSSPKNSLSSSLLSKEKDKASVPKLEKKDIKQEKKDSSSTKNTPKTPDSTFKNGVHNSSKDLKNVSIKKEKLDIQSSRVKEEAKSPTKSQLDLKNIKKRTADDSQNNESPKKRKKKEDEEEEIWRWWEEKKYADGRKWTTLVHKGPLFEPGYSRLPDSVSFYYDNKKIKLSSECEEVMTFYAKMIDHDYTKKDSFNTNFFNDWRKVFNK